jgi:hypothetical protein
MSTRRQRLTSKGPPPTIPVSRGSLWTPSALWSRVSRKARHYLVTFLRSAYVIVGYRVARLRGQPSLTAIVNFYGSDKGTVYGYSPRVFGGHDYGPVYTRHFQDLRQRPVRLLEVGIGLEGPGAVGATVSTRNRGGASLKAWRDFFPRGHIYGIDINDGRFLDGPRLSTFVADQASRTDLQAVIAGIGAPLDIIIDDGSHASSHQQIALGCLLPHLVAGGLYVIEDLDTQPAHLEGPDDVKTSELLRSFKEMGRFESGHLTPAERDYIERHLQVLEFFESSGTHRGQLVVLTTHQPA